MAYLECLLTMLGYGPSCSLVGFTFHAENKHISEKLNMNHLKCLAMMTIHDDLILRNVLTASLLLRFTTFWVLSVRLLDDGYVQDLANLGLALNGDGDGLTRHYDLHTRMDRLQIDFQAKMS